MGAGARSFGDGVAAAPNGDVTLTGYSFNTADFGTGALTSAGEFDGFVAGIGP